MTAQVRLLESVAQQSLRVDREAGVLYGVKLLGEKSTNPPPEDHDYPHATRERALKLFEGARVFVDHPPPDRQTSRTGRSYRDRMGVIKNVTNKPDGVYGDYHFNPRHPLAEQLTWDAENAPETVGFSINGNGRPSRKGGRCLIEEITQLYSVDLVSRPGTTKGLFESERPVMITAKALREQLKDTRPGYAKALREMAEAGVLGDDALMDPPADVPAETAPEVDHEQAILDAAKACLDDTSLNAGEKMAKIKKLLGIIESKGGGASDTSTETATEESAREENRRLKLELAGVKACQEAGVRLDDVMTLAISACKDEAQVKKLVESARGSRGQSGARSSTPAAPKKLNESEVPADPNKRAAWLHS